MNSLGIRIAQSLFRGRIHRETNRHLSQLSDIEGNLQDKIERELGRLKNNEDCFELGKTCRGFPINIPLLKLITHSLIVGTTGAGKSCAALLFLNHAIQNFLLNDRISLGILDPKGETSRKAIDYVHAHAYKMNDDERRKLKGKVLILDFSRSDYITPYNILNCKNIPVELLVNNRIETISQIFQGPSALTSRMKSILKYFMLLMIENNLPITTFEQICQDPDLVRNLALKSKNRNLKRYFLHRFPKEPNVSILGLRQRIDSLFVSESVRLSLSADSSPDFQKLQDQGYLVIINIAGPYISRMTTEFLMRIILSDIQQSVFRRRNTYNKFLWAIDEAQVLYKDQSSRENMNDLLTMARSFGSYFMLLTQSLTSAVRDINIINSILANIQWILLFRSTSRDAKIIAPAIPMTGTMLTPKRHLYDQQKYMTTEQELKKRLEEITYFPLRQGYFWLKSHLPRAIKMKTTRLPNPEEIAECTREELIAFSKQFPIINMISGRQIKKEMEAKECVLFNKNASTAFAHEDLKNSKNGKDSQNMIDFLDKTFSKRRVS